MNRAIQSDPQQGGLVNPQVTIPGPAANEPGSNPGENPGPGIMPPLPNDPRPGDPPMEPAPRPTTPQPSPTQPPVPPSSPPSMEA